MNDENYKLRRLLFVRHGCAGPALYGDDGELQCNKCGIDFRRMSPDDISNKWFMKALDEMAARATSIKP